MPKDTQLPSPQNHPGPDIYYISPPTSSQSLSMLLLTFARSLTPCLLLTISTAPLPHRISIQDLITLPPDRGLLPCLPASISVSSNPSHTCLTPLPKTVCSRCHSLQNPSVTPGIFLYHPVTCLSPPLDWRLLESSSLIYMA